MEPGGTGGVGGEHQLELPGVAPPRGQQRVMDEARGRIVDTQRKRGLQVGHRLPQGLGWVEDEEVDIALLGDSGEGADVARRHRGEPVHTDPIG